MQNPTPAKIIIDLGPFLNMLHLVFLLLKLCIGVECIHLLIILQAMTNNKLIITG